MLSTLRQAVDAAQSVATPHSQEVSKARGDAWLGRLSLDLPQAAVHVEVFGGLPVLLRQEPRGVEVYNDTANGATDLFRSLRRPKLLYHFQRLHRKCGKTELSTDDLVVMCRESSDRMVRTYAWFRLALELFGQQETGLWGRARERDYSTISKHEAWGQELRGVLTDVDTALPNLHGRLMRVQYERSSWGKMLKLYDSPETLFWIDMQPTFLRRFGTEGPKQFEHVISNCKAKVAFLLWRKSVPKFLQGWSTRILRPELQLATNF